MLTDDTAREQVVLSLLVAALVVGISLVREARSRKAVTPAE
ncbi:Amino acid permease OS=Streptomyces cyaneofuscatus OX=66883 GN=G3I52_27955 PE=3 SV=1 [Streptomyces cyaneofuscatus]